MGGVQCPTASVYFTTEYYTASLPTFDYDPSVAYDLVISNDAGNVTFSGEVRYTSAPTLISIDPCIDRGDAVLQYYGVRCSAGTTITLRGSRFPAADTVTVQFVPAYPSPPVNVELLAATRINSSTITATLPAFDNAIIAAAVLGAYGSVQIAFTSNKSSNTTNALSTVLYTPPDAPNVTSISSSACDSVSALQLTNCRALAVITVVGSNLAANQWLEVYSVNVWQGYNYLLPDGSDSSTAASNGTWYDSLSNTSLVFTMAYFDADTNVQLQPEVVYTVLLVQSSSYGRDPSNAFRLSLTYAAVVPSPPSSSSSAAVTAPAAAASTAAAAASTASSNTLSSSSLSSGAIAGIVIAAAVAAVLLAVVVMWLLRYRVSDSSSSWWSKSAHDGWQQPVRGGADSSSEAYTDVELH